MPSATSLQTDWLKRIAQHGPLIKTYLEKRRGSVLTGKREVVYSLAGGQPVPTGVAERLIHSNMLVPQKDGMFDDCQSWRAKTPADQ